MARTPKLRSPAHPGEKLGAGWVTVAAIMYPPVSMIAKLDYEHIERIPQTGPALLVVNHISHVDPFLMSKFVLDAGRTPLFLAKESIFEVPVIGGAMRWMGHIPVKRGTTDARQSLAAAVAALERGACIVLHPEGTVTRDPDGWPMAGKTGAARLASLVPDVPVIPVAQWGVQENFDLYRKRIKPIPRPRHVFSVGEPIDLSAFRDRDPTNATLHQMTDVIMKRLRSDVAELRGLSAPTGELFRWVRPTGKPDAA